jgi:hypothetical protein
MQNGGAVILTTKASMPVAAILVMLVGCSPTIPTTSPASLSKEPFSIKPNETLGISLGMDLSDYKRSRLKGAWDHFQENAPGEAFCAVDLTRRDLKTLMIGEVQIWSCDFRFYRMRLIQIDYGLTSIDWGSLQNAMEEKFGLPTYRGKFEATGKKLSDQTLLWRNAVSSLRFDLEEKDRTAATLSMQLDQETDQWLEDSRKRSKAAAKRGL